MPMHERLPHVPRQLRGRLVDAPRARRHPLDVRAASVATRAAASLLFLALASGAARPATAQGDAAGRPSFGASAGASFYSPGAPRLGTETDRDLYLAGIRAEWMLRTGQRFAIATTIDAIPLSVVTRNPYYTHRISGYVITQGGGRVDLLHQTGRGPVYGIGASPLGLELFGPRIHALRPYLAAAGGFLWFTRNTPEPEARRLNASFELGGGLRVERGGHHTLLLGWKFHQISNAWTAPFNPGLDGNGFYVGSSGGDGLRIRVA